MKTLPRISLMAYYKKQNVYCFIPEGSTLLFFLCRSFCYGKWHKTEFIFFSVCAVLLTFDMKVIFQMFEETLQST